MQPFPQRLGRLAVLLVLLGGCATGQRARWLRDADKPHLRTPVMAREHNDRGLEELENGNLDAAREQFQEAILCDMYYAPAHNNLGLVLLQQNQPYDAAWEFQSAIRLSPHAAEPRANLGLLYEEIGRVDHAITKYKTALEYDPENAAVMRHLARAYVKAGKKDDSLKSVLETLLGVPDDGPWDYWVRGQLIRVGREEGPTQLFEE